MTDQAPDTADASRRSPLHDIHAALGAAFTDFGGWSMPVRYGSELAEHAAVREAAGLFDISHMAELVVAGPQAAAYLDYALAANVSAIELSRAKYTMLLDETGGIIDDLIVYHNAPDEYLVVANAGNRAAVVTELTARIDGFDATLTDATESIALIALQGPAAREILAGAPEFAVSEKWSMGHSLDTLPYYACFGMTFRQSTAVLVARTGYTGEDGFELYVPLAQAADLWNTLLAAGTSRGLVPAGLAARDTLRLEAGMPLYGQELSRHVQPAQAGLGRVVPLKSKSAAFVGREAIEAGLPEGAPVLVGLVAEGRRAPRTGYAVLDTEGREAGIVTSGALSPTLGHPVAMAFVNPEHAEPGTELGVDVRGTSLPARVVALPFYRRGE